MKKLLLFAALLIPLTACFLLPKPANSMPYRVWKDWDEMKEVLGDDYLYPTYLPECTKGKVVFLASMYNYYPTNPDGTDRRLDPDDPDLYYSYNAAYHSSDYSNDRFYFTAIDYNRYREGWSSTTSDNDYYEVFHVIIETLNGIDVEFRTRYREYINENSADSIIPNTMIVSAIFTYNDITYGTNITQFDVEDKYADSEQREELIKVAKSIIEQNMEDE